jgi:hypothetical protein
MKKYISLLSLLIFCGAIRYDNNYCGADELQDILGTWYTTSQEPGPIPGYYRTDSTLWILERVPLKFSRGITFMDSLRVTIEYHRGGESFDPAKHGQKTTTLPANVGKGSYGVQAYGTARFEIPDCDSLIIRWTDETIHRLRRKR